MRPRAVLFGIVEGADRAYRRFSVGSRPRSASLTLNEAYVSFSASTGSGCVVLWRTLKTPT